MASLMQVVKSLWKATDRIAMRVILYAHADVTKEVKSRIVTFIARRNCAVNEEH